jgi:hypothetical protein
MTAQNAVFLYIYMCNPTTIDFNVWLNFNVRKIFPEHWTGYEKIIVDSRKLF